MSWQRPAVLLCLQMLSIGGAMASGSLLLACIFAVGVLWHCSELIGDYKRGMSEFDRSLLRHCGKAVQLEVSERGFLEHDLGIESFCPWSAMKNYCIRDDVLFVELANGLWAIIPAETLKPDTITLAQIEAVLVEHRVPLRG